MRRLICLVLLCAAAPLTRQARAQTTDYLLPADGYFSSFHYANEYFPKVRATLLKGLPDTPVARVIFLPFAAPEYIVSVEEEAGRYYLTYAVASQRIWSLAPADSARQVAATSRRVEVQPAFAKALGDLCNTALFQVRYLAPGSRQATTPTGTTYIFTTFQYGRGAKSGKASSPAPGTKLAELASLAERLPALATAGSGSNKLQEELLVSLRALAQQFATP